MHVEGDTALRVMVVDDDDGLRRALRRRIALLGYHVEDERDPHAALDAVAENPPHCLILDLAMPSMSGLDVQQALAARLIEVPTVFLSGRGDVPSVVSAMRDGALDFLEKPVEDADLAAAIERALQRGSEMESRRAEIAGLQSRSALLTARQREVFVAVARGAPNKVIAHELGISERTVKAHRSEVMEKLSVRSAAELALAAEKLGLLSD